MGVAENTGHKKYRQKLPSVHHRTTLSGYIFATKARIDNRKKIVKQQYLLRMSSNMVNFGPLATEIVSLVWGTELISTSFASWQRYCAALQYWASAKLCGVEQRVPTIFGRAAITLGIGHIQVLRFYGRPM